MAAALAAVVFGCRGGPNTAAVDPPKPDPDQVLYDQCRTSAFQLGLALNAIEEALNNVQDLPKATAGDKAAISEMQGYMNAAGSAIADDAETPPEFEGFKKDLAKWQAAKKKAAEDAKKAVGSLTSAKVIADSLAAPGHSEISAEASKASGLIASAIDDCNGAG